LLPGKLEGCYRWKYDTPETYTTTLTENIKQLRVACSECTCTLYCGCSDNILDWFKDVEYTKINENLLSVACSPVMEKNAFRISSLTVKSCACVYIEFLARIFSWSVDCSYCA
jgi:hypothetical protein